MKLIKHFTKRGVILGSVVLCCFALLLAGFSLLGSRQEPETARYSGKNGNTRVQFTRYRDYRVFLEKKSPDISIYDSKDEVKDVKGFIAGGGCSWKDAGKTCRAAISNWFERMEKLSVIFY